MCKREKQLSRKHFISRIFSPLNRKDVTDFDLITKFENYLRMNTNISDISEEKIQNIARYFVYNIFINIT